MEPQHLCCEPFGVHGPKVNRNPGLDECNHSTKDDLLNTNLCFVRISTATLHGMSARIDANRNNIMDTVHKEDNKRVLQSQNFEVIIEREELFDVDSDILRVHQTVNKYNRTCKAFSSNFTLLKDLNDDVTVDVQLFALYSNEYRPTPINFKRNACDMFKFEFLWIKSEIIKHNHFPTQCPVLAGNYYLKDFVPNGADFPAAANLPWTNCMLCLRFLYQNKIFSTFKLYLTLDHDVELKRLG
ncbi:hypothetical protein CBL_09563 [Carabus blaptoides fortunei]